MWLASVTFYRERTLGVKFRLQSMREHVIPTYLLSAARSSSSSMQQQEAETHQTNSQASRDQVSYTEGTYAPPAPPRITLSLALHSIQPLTASSCAAKDASLLYQALLASCNDCRCVQLVSLAGMAPAAL
jgi:hypothetical protein